MRAMRFLPPAVPLILLLSGCDQPGLQQSSGSTTPAYERIQQEASPEQALQVPVRIGELGSGFSACSARGTTRRVVGEGESIEVRSAPFEASKQTAALPHGSTFFVCSRSLDQKWFGVVFDAAGTAAASCGVLAPVPARRDYAGPCKSGWISSASVKLSGAADVPVTTAPVPETSETLSNSAAGP
jgi:hypothetical protein